MKRTKSGMPRRDRRRDSRDLAQIEKLAASLESRGFISSAWIAEARLLRSILTRLANLELRRDRKQECRRRPSSRRRKDATA